MAEAGLVVRLRQAAPIPLDVTFEVAAGTLLALVGASGSGKSTILRTIAGLYRPETGSVSCQGVQWLDTQAGIDLSPQRRRVGLVFQNYALFPHMTALGNVAAALSHRPADERDGIAAGFIERVGLRGLEHRRPDQLSGGQQQRVAVARALAREPLALLLDEPFSAVDRPARRQLQAMLAGLRTGLNIPVLLVTHDIDEAASLADGIAVLDGGRTVQQGAPAALMAAPATEAVAQMLGGGVAAVAGVQACEFQSVGTSA